jgi:hypothetical protein
VRLKIRTVSTRSLAAAALGLGALVAGCGGDDREPPRASGSGAARAAPTATAMPPRGPVPEGVRSVESAAEDTIDFALAGRRGKAVETANALRTAASGPVGEELRAAGVSGSEIAEFQARADRVARLAPEADLLRVALASNRAFAMVPGFFARYETRVPSEVLVLDHLDFEAKLQARAGDLRALRAAVGRLDRAWAALRPDLVQAGGGAVALTFDAHVRRIRRLAARHDSARAEREAQRGLELVDELETVYAG